MEFVAFCRSNIKNEIWILQDNPRKPVKYWIPICALNHQNFAQKFLPLDILAHFSANFYEFEIILEQSIIIVEKQLLYENTSIFNENTIE